MCVLPLLHRQRAKRVRYFLRSLTRGSARLSVGMDSITRRAKAAAAVEAEAALSLGLIGMNLGASSGAAVTVDDQPSSAHVGRVEPSDDKKKPGGEARRAALDSLTNSSAAGVTTRSAQVFASDGEATVDSTEAAVDQLEPPAVNLLMEWAAGMFTDPQGKRVSLTKLSVAFQSTNGLLMHAKEAVQRLFEKRRKDICSSPERPDLKMSQEEALGWLLGYACGRELLTEDARKIGKVAGTQATVAKKERDAITASAKTQRGNARKREGADAAIAAIDRTAADAKEKIFLTVYTIVHMPAANAVIAESRAPTQQEMYATLRRKLLKLREVAEAIRAASLLEGRYMSTYCGFEEGDYVDEEELDVAKLRFSHAMRRLKAAVAESTCGQRDVPLFRYEDEHIRASEENSHPCPCGEDRISPWPWMPQPARLGFCCNPMCDIKTRTRTAWVNATAGSNFAW